jgi:murein DD-endopeptidase MepM/ murein hydrolase activator NlpD
VHANLEPGPGATAESQVSHGQKASSTQQPFIEAAPLEALPIDRSASLGGLSAKASTSSGDSLERRFNVAVVPSAGSDSSLAGGIVRALNASGITARLTDLDTAGRPDALLMLDEQARTAEAWFCDPGPPISAILAREVLGVVSGFSPVAAGSQLSETELGNLFPCDRVQQQRAGTAAALVRLPSSIDSGIATAAIAESVDRFLARNALTILRSRNQRLIWPAHGALTNGFGPGHPLGVDIGQMRGKVVAASDGVVVWAGGDPCCGYGMYVVIRGSGGMETLYAHFSSLVVKTGDRVRQGQALGEVGCTGVCSGPHLHFEVRLNGRVVNPLLHLP